jgi:hypothetical protein
MAEYEYLLTPGAACFAALATCGRADSLPASSCAEAEGIEHSMDAAAAKAAAASLLRPRKRAMLTLAFRTETLSRNQEPGASFRSAAEPAVPQSSQSFVSALVRNSE